MLVGIVVCVTVLTDSTLVVGSGVTGQEMPSLLNSGRLHIGNINQNIVNTEFAVEGLVHQRALELKVELKQGIKKPFEDLIEADTGDIADQKLITFVRQVTAAACLPELLDDTTFPDDVKSRVQNLLQHFQGNSIGSLTDSSGLKMVRRHIAEFIRQRDNNPSRWDDIIIVPGISAAVKILSNLMNFSSNGLPPGVLLPVPQFPLLTRALTEFGVKKLDYFLDEETGWSVVVDELQQVLLEGKTHCQPRAIVVINPGNPTGQLLSRKNMEDIIKFAEREKLLIIAFEVYQDNVYEDNIFQSFKKVLYEMEAPYKNTELVSLMSCFRGYAEEVGLRGGYMELYNIGPAVKDFLKKNIMISDSPPACAQIALDCITNPPKLGEPSYPLFASERAALLTSVAERAKLINRGINRIPGLSCQPVQGSFFAFIKVDIPEKAVEQANSLNLSPSTFYGLEMLEKSGVVVVPGDGFGQKPGTHHFRMTILLPEERLKEALLRIQKFHIEFVNQYCDDNTEIDQ
ncbi:alanine aminotransferase 1-like isoform X1 [Homalodisca vitripennis]|uniref:alanine aminotransferase 1-like isoform X1 n=2 Tax=Homalodisca vitripennis TaxID=197043 RepID=UPI001EEA0B3C|nr:alanine aminotransferase 1-like isoform X1 [Homalodisca vitripennis]